MRSLRMTRFAARLPASAIAPFPWPVAPPADLRQLSPPAALALNGAAMTDQFVHAPGRRTAPVAGPAMAAAWRGNFVPICHRWAPGGGPFPGYAGNRNPRVNVNQETSSDNPKTNRPAHRGNESSIGWRAMPATPVGVSTQRHYPLSESIKKEPDTGVCIPSTAEKHVFPSLMDPR